MHRLIWGEEQEWEFALTDDEPLECVAYLAAPEPEAFVEPTAVGRPVPEMSVFLTTETYVPLPLDETYHAAWEAVPAVWREALEATGAA